MTTKRFTYRYNGDCESEWEIIDLDDDVYYGMDTTENCVKSLVELLNDFYNENEQLKNRIDDYNVALKTLQDLTEKKINENEQLKQQKTELLRIIENNIEIYENINTNVEFHQGEIQGKLTVLNNLREVILND